MKNAEALTGQIEDRWKRIEHRNNDNPTIRKFYGASHQSLFLLYPEDFYAIIGDVVDLGAIAAMKFQILGIYAISRLHERSK